MTLKELEENEDFFLHDAELKDLHLDYVSLTATITLDIWTPEETETETYRSARLTFTGLQFCSIEPPDPRYPYAEPGALWIDDGPSETSDSAQPSFPLTPGTFLHSFYVRDWNTFIRIAARDVRIEWLGEPVVRTREPEV